MLHSSPAGPGKHFSQPRDHFLAHLCMCTMLSKIFENLDCLNLDCICSHMEPMIWDKQTSLNPLTDYFLTQIELNFRAKVYPLDTQEEGSNITCVPGIIAFCRCPLLRTRTTIPIGIQLCGNNRYYRRIPSRERSWTSLASTG